ncbi:MAG: ABC transporter ATP-binding protein [Candidatus Caldarchaeum sp.]|nr:ABC transporter ATP-binding protein [Candidatus Caldarchaeales archaeon]
MSLLEVRKLNVAYGRLQVLWDINISLSTNNVVGIIGPNGAGKTTLLKTIAGTIKPLSGEINYMGQKINGLPAHERVKQGIVYVPDSSGVFGKMSVYDNLILGAYLKRDQLNETLKFVYELFPTLHERRNQRAGTLSGGEKQMLVIARALMVKPKVLLLDEPSTGLSPIAVKNLFTSLEKLLSTTDLSIILVEQDVGRALKISKYVYLMEGGHVRDEGPSNEFSKVEKLRKFYVGA